jgi:hypothetical protein
MSRDWSHNHFERGKATDLSDYPNESRPQVRPIRIAVWVLFLAVALFFWGAALSALLNQIK